MHTWLLKKTQIEENGQKRRDGRFSGISVKFKAILDCKTTVHDLIACAHAQGLMCCCTSKWGACLIFTGFIRLSTPLAFHCTALYENMQTAIKFQWPVISTSGLLAQISKAICPYITKARCNHCLYVGNIMPKNNCYVKLYLKAGVKDQSFASDSL